MRLFLLLTLIGTITLRAQVSVIIEDERGEGFYLGINGYIQNEEKKTTLLIKDLDTSRYTFSIRSGSTEFAKNIQLREKGMHKYILTKDYYGKLKLRYRGMESKAPGDITALAYHQEIRWPVVAGTAAIAAQLTSENEALESEASAKDPSTSSAAAEDSSTDSVTVTAAVKDTSANEAWESEALAKDSSTGSAAAIDSSTGSATGVSITAVTSASSVTANTTVDDKISDNTPLPAPNDGHAFHSFLEELKAQEFEFDKLSMCQEYAAAKSLSSEQLGAMFQELSYDQSRMQLIRSNLKDISDPQNLPELSRYFEYEITKSQYILFINE
jgi:hypothetical protein